jgi:hypothetical protein
MRFYTKRVPPERLYFTERNRIRRHRLLRLGRWQLWMARDPKPFPTAR